MLSGTYSSIFIATPVLADLKERQPQYQALAKRVAVRASGGRAAKRAAAKAEVAGRGRSGGTGAGLSSSPLAEAPLAEAPLAEAPLAEDEQDKVGFADDVEGSEPAADELTTTASRAPGAPASRGTPGAVRPGPRQQPRRGGGNTPRHRPAGKKKRR
jgi:preprotein translocase subunit SecF